MTTMQESNKSGTITYKPLGEEESIELTIGTVRRFIAARTKSGKEPDDGDIVKFMMLCKARQLNPWVGDAYLVGYDGKDGPQYSLITGIQALLKRAEASPDFDGLTGGVIVQSGDGLDQRSGSLVMDNETIIGGWAKCWRKDVSQPFEATVKFSVYDTGRSRWAVDPGGMITKVAKAAVLREAFPTQLGGMYVAEEFDRHRDRPRESRVRASTLEAPRLDLSHREQPKPKPEQDAYDAYLSRIEACVDTDELGEAWDHIEVDDELSDAAKAGLKVLIDQKAESLGART